MDHISLIGAPTDVGASVLGCRMGPAALRLAGIQESLERFGSEVHDCGDVTGPDNPGAFAVDGYRHLAEVTAWNHAVFDAVYAELVGGRLPIMLGGDHSLAIGSISAAARHCRETGKRLRVLWFDAHADYNTASITPSGNMHGMPVAVLTGNGPEPLLNLSGAVPAVDPHDVREIGLRDVDLGEKHLLAEHEVEVFDMRYLDEIGVRHAMEMALKGVDENTHLHVSLDLDFLDDSIAPGVGTPVRGGPTYREAHLCMEMIADTGRLGSLDIVELNPALDVRSQTSTLAVDLVESLFGKSTLLRVHRR
jgi:arginase